MARKAWGCLTWRWSAESAAEAVQAQSKVSTESSLFINGDAWLRSEVGGLDVLEGLLQSLNDFRMFVVEVIGFSEVLFQVVELGRRIAGLGGRHGFLRPGFSVATISLSFDELPLAHADGESPSSAAGENDRTFWVG